MLRAYEAMVSECGYIIRGRGIKTESIITGSLPQACKEPEITRIQLMVFHKLTIDLVLKQ